MNEKIKLTSNLQIFHEEKEAFKEVDFEFYNTSFGEVLIASTAKGICFAGFVQNKNEAFKELHEAFPDALLSHYPGVFHIEIIGFFDKPFTENTEQTTLALHLTGNIFQIDVWKELLKIQPGQTRSYKEIAEKIGKPRASRAVGTAIGKNLIAVLIPCHRVIASNGGLGGYKWGLEKKKQLLELEKTY